jgi:hypothetical protein
MDAGLHVSSIQSLKKRAGWAVGMWRGGYVPNPSLPRQLCVLRALAERPELLPKMVRDLGRAPGFALLLTQREATSAQSCRFS